jgi:Family of unknown function (DUF5857)
MSSNVGRYSDTFAQGDLGNLTKFTDTGEIRVSKGGCANPNYYGTECTGFFPSNGEYETGAPDPNNPSNNCNRCDVSGPSGCSYYDTSGSGKYCACNNSGVNYQGRRCSVKRLAYNADPATCCIVAANPSTHGNTTGVYTNGLFQWYEVGFDTYTCDPNLLENCPLYANSIANNCQTISRNDTAQAWFKGSSKAPDDTTGYCLNYINNTYPTDKKSAQIVLSTAMNYAATSVTDFGKSNPKTAQAISNMVEACSTYGGCDSALTKLCSAQTRESVVAAYDAYTKSPTTDNLYNKNIYQACACHLPADQYTKWANLGVDESHTACDPICMLPNAVSQWVNGQPAQCTQNLCIISDVTIDIIKSQTGPINFDIVCGCGKDSKPGSCRCIFSDVNIFESGSNILGGLNFQQNCGGNCQVPDPKNPGNFLQVDCNNGIPVNPQPPGPSPSSTGIWQWIKKNSSKIFVVGMVIAIIFGAIYWYKNMKPVTKNISEMITLDDAFQGTLGEAILAL